MANKRVYLEHQLKEEELRRLKEIALKGGCSIKWLTTELVRNLINGRLTMRPDVQAKRS
jgi:hypothetical protein